MQTVDLTRRAKFHQNITLKNFVQLDGKGEWGEGDGWQRYLNKEVLSDVCLPGFVQWYKYRPTHS